MKTRNEEIKYLGQMLGATKENDTARITSIAASLLQISIDYQMGKPEVGQQGEESGQVKELKMKTRNVEIVQGGLEGFCGVFHGFFQAGDGDGYGAVAIVELADGKVVEVDATTICFPEQDKAES